MLGYLILSANGNCEAEITESPIRKQSQKGEVTFWDPALSDQVGEEIYHAGGLSLIPYSVTYLLCDPRQLGYFSVPHRFVEWIKEGNLNKTLRMMCCV